MHPGLPHPVIDSLVGELEEQFVTALDDDLNISGAIGALFGFIKKVNPVLYAGSVDQSQKNEILSLLRKMNRVFGFLRLEQCILAPEINRLIEQREEARRRRDWETADKARTELLQKGIIVHDTANGPVWEQDEACKLCENATK
jgi:cysteinyl-tRNA synthetase